MTYVKLVTLAVFMLTIFLIIQTKNVEAAGQCPSVGSMIDMSQKLKTNHACYPP
ncbi:hypothetical protein MtrunA17_Chr3g0092941 [Medicago truncatula]|uniref:Leginsulin related MtN11/16/17 family n=1 Tax=Medicago truncatula TaxID=3880 RepID=A0A072TIF6_MEDTR|nr:leginsulin related MtN11/16/17 family [Medicago truncatula]RHN66598.1 hypothetical protein MtrunA17_Chr3g0092941 [Medicago truncatula]